jgi:hypothetical protein
MAASSNTMGNLSSTFEKANSAYSSNARQFMDKNKQLTLRNELMALKIRMGHQKPDATLVLA